MAPMMSEPFSLSLNEGLPQKGKQFPGGLDGLPGILASMKGFPRRGSNLLQLGIEQARGLASMKGFPRRGSNGAAAAGPGTMWKCLNEGLPQKGKQSEPPRTTMLSVSAPQ